MTIPGQETESSRRFTRRGLLKAAAASGGAALLGAHLLAEANAPLIHSAITERIEGPYRVILSNGIPEHPIGLFPNPGCPCPVRPIRHVYRVPLAPVPAPALLPIGYVELGVARNGVPFDPAGPYLEGDPSSGFRFEVLSATARQHLGIDAWQAHSQPNGAYHYHGFTPALLQAVPDVTARMTLIGWAADGFPIYAPTAPTDPLDLASPLTAVRPSYRLRSGSRPPLPGGKHDGTFVEDYEFVAGLGDLDEANGRTGVTPEFPRGTYHYFATTDFPFLPRFFRGTPDPSFASHSSGPGLSGVPPALRAYRG
jgi:hypothetical protein